MTPTADSKPIAATADGTPGNPDADPNRVRPTSDCAVLEPMQSEYSQLILHGVAGQTAEIIRFAASLEDSSLFARVQMRVKESVIWEGRRAEEFELVCDLAGQERAAP